MTKPATKPGGLPPFDLTTPIDIQQALDNLLASNPTLQQYVTKLWYIREGTPPPADVTHTLRLASVGAAERHLLIGLVVVPQFAAFLDLLLSMIATQPPSAV